MGAVGHMRGVDSALLFVMAAADDNPLQPKAARNTLRVTWTMHIYVVHTEPAEGGRQLLKSMSTELKALTWLYEALLYLGKLEP